MNLELALLVSIRWGKLMSNCATVSRAQRTTHESQHLSKTPHLVATKNIRFGDDQMGAKVDIVGLKIKCGRTMIPEWNGKAQQSRLLMMDND